MYSTLYFTFSHALQREDTKQVDNKVYATEKNLETYVTINHTGYEDVSDEKDFIEVMTKNPKIVHKTFKTVSTPYLDETTKRVREALNSQVLKTRELNKKQIIVNADNKGVERPKNKTASVDQRRQTSPDIEDELW